MDGSGGDLEPEEYESSDDLASPAERLLARWRERERREPRLEVPDLIVGATLVALTLLAIGFSVSPALGVAVHWCRGQ